MASGACPLSAKRACRRRSEPPPRGPFPSLRPALRCPPAMPPANPLLLSPGNNDDFSSSLTTASKLVVAAVMLLGRHRDLSGYIASLEEGESDGAAEGFGGGRIEGNIPIGASRGAIRPHQDQGIELAGLNLSRF